MLPAVTKPAQSGNPVVRAIQWASDTVERRSQRVWKALQTDRHSGSDDADDDDADIKSGMLKVEAAMSQAERILGRLSDLAEKRIMKVRTCICVQPMTLENFARMQHWRLGMLGPVPDEGEDMHCTVQPECLGP